MLLGCLYLQLVFLKFHGVSVNMYMPTCAQYAVMHAQHANFPKTCKGMKFPCGLIHELWSLGYYTTYCTCTTHAYCMLTCVCMSAYCKYNLHGMLCMNIGILCMDVSMVYSAIDLLESPHILHAHSILWQLSMSYTGPVAYTTSTHAVLYIMHYFCTNTFLLCRCKPYRKLIRARRQPHWRGAVWFQCVGWEPVQLCLLFTVKTSQWRMKNFPKTEKQSKK